MWRELCYYASLSQNKFDFKFLPYGLHGDPNQLRKEVQQAVDETPAGFDAILLGYGLCSKGVEGVSAVTTRLVITRGHDCMTCFLGSKTRYREYFDAHPGTYWYTPGWIENHLAPGKDRYEWTYRHYVEKYGEEDAQYLMEMEQGWFQEYSNAAYVDMGIGNFEKHKAYTQQCAEWLKWRYDEIQGDGSLFRRFVDGIWDSNEFLMVEPGYFVEATNDENIFRAAPRKPSDQTLESTSFANDGSGREFLKTTLH